MTLEQQEEVRLLQESLLRNKVRASLVEWARLLGFEPALHHKLLISKLEAVTNGELQKLMVLMPPGSAKSTYVSKAFPPWYLCRFPKHPILACSHAATLAEQFGRCCRNYVDQYSTILGYALAKDSQAAMEWETDQGGRYFCAGVGAKIAGHRAALGFIDDYLGTQEEADSQLIRDKIWAWYWNDFYPRLWPGAPQIIVANWRHEDDLVGRLIATEGKSWHIVKLPFLAEQDDPLGRSPGGILWPEWFNLDMVKEVRTMPRVWSGLYQQRPSPEEGDYFKREWLVTYTLDDLAAAERSGLRYYCASDHAVRLKQENDPSLLVAFGADQQGRLWVMPDWVWEKMNALETCEAMLRMARKYKPIRWWSGKDHITGSIGPFLSKMMLESKFFFPLEELSDVKDKPAKARAISGRMAQRMVLFPGFAPRFDEVVHELLTFPGATHDEWPDVLGNVGRGLEQIMPAALPVAQQENLASFTARWRPTIGWVKRSHEKKCRSARLAALDY